MSIQKMKELNKALEQARREKEIAMLAIEKREIEIEKAKVEKIKKAEEIKKVRWQDRDVVELMRADVGELLLPAITKLFSEKDEKWIREFKGECLQWMNQDVGEMIRPAMARIFPQIDKDIKSETPEKTTPTEIKTAENQKELKAKMIDDDTEVKKIRSLVAIQKAAGTKAGMATLLVFAPYITGVMIITILCYLTIDISLYTYIMIAKEKFSVVGLWTIGYFTISSIVTLFFLHTIFYNFLIILKTKKQ